MIKRGEERCGSSDKSKGNGQAGRDREEEGREEKKAKTDESYI